MNNLSLFSGGGIGELAAHEAGINTVAMCESDEWCRYALERLWPGVPVFPDIRALTVDALPVGIDIISGGSPCQDISSAGKGVGITGERSALWFEMLRLVREVRPAWVLLENVPALRTRGADIVLDGLAEAGYTAWPVVVGADNCGAPHRRKRVWIVGNADIERRDERADVADGTAARSISGESQVSESQSCEGSRGHVPNPALVRCGPRRPESGGLRGPWRWPLGPGAEQHEWEWPRVICNAKFDGPTQPPLGGTTDGLPGTIPASARRAALRILGNSWVPQIPYLIYRWIVANDALFSGGE